MATVRQETIAAVLVVCGCSPARFNDSDGTSKREAPRVFLHGTVRPLRRMLAAELSAKFETDVALDFSGLYMHDLAGRAQSVKQVDEAGMDPAKAAAHSGLMTDD